MHCYDKKHISTILYYVNTPFAIYNLNLKYLSLAHVEKAMQKQKNYANKWDFNYKTNLIPRKLSS